MINTAIPIQKLFYSKIIKTQIGPEYNRTFKKEEGYIWEGYLILKLNNGYTLNFKLYHNYTKDPGGKWYPQLDNIYSQMRLYRIIPPESDKFLNARDHVLFFNDFLYFFNKSFSQYYSSNPKWIKKLMKRNHLLYGRDYEIICNVAIL
jgi:hypothetical protein